MGCGLSNNMPGDILTLADRAIFKPESEYLWPGRRTLRGIEKHGLCSSLRLHAPILDTEMGSAGRALCAKRRRATRSYCL
mgnify:CR=1 FL=1